MTKIALYTVNTGGYDNCPPLPPSIVFGIDCYYVTDDPEAQVPKDSAWKIKVVEPEEDPHRHQRRLKTEFHKLFPEYDTVIYVDANIHLRVAMKHVLQLHRGGITTTTHPQRTCVYQEAEACEKLNKAPKEMIRQQMDAYRKEGIPANLGMVQTGFIIRDNTPEVRAFCEAWNREIETHTHRDQLSVTVVAHRMKMLIGRIPFPTFVGFATITKHASGGAKFANIWYSTPYATDGNIGKAYNDFCEMVPGRDDWIVLRDGDCMFTTPDWGRQIEEVLRTHGDKYQVYGAMTNRIRSLHQRVTPDMFDETNMVKLVDKGFELEKEQWGKVEDGGRGVAGFFMAFRRSTWEKAKFREREKAFDTLFCKDVVRSGGKIGLMKGLFLIHEYRMWAENPTGHTKHLDVVGHR